VTENRSEQISKDLGFVAINGESMVTSTIECLATKPNFVWFSIFARRPFESKQSLFEVQFNHLEL
jgi:hypothetical protein